MAVILTLQKSRPLSYSFPPGKIVLVGGCFDLFHQGHKAFLTRAKEQGDTLVVLIENDHTVKQKKGNDRPYETQTVRATKLSKEPYVDFIILLPENMENHNYDKLVSDLKPAIIATTKGDPGRHHKERTASKVGAQVIDVIERLPEYSTTKQIKTYVN